jgi:hypothetical protein
MTRSIAKLDATLARRPRELRLVYMHAVAEQVIAKSRFLHKTFEDRTHDDFVIYSS